MLKIKLTRLGKKSEPRYRIVVNECRDKRDGQYVAQIGLYHAAETPKKLELDLAAYEEWLKKGAKPTPTVAFLYQVVKDGKGFPEGKAKLSKKAKAKIKAEEEAKAAAEEEKKAAAATKEETVVEVKTETQA